MSLIPLNVLVILPFSVSLSLVCPFPHVLPEDCFLLPRRRSPPTPPWCRHTRTGRCTCLSGCWCCRPPRWCSPCATPAPWFKTAPATWHLLLSCPPRSLKSSSALSSSSWRAVSRMMDQGDVGLDSVSSDIPQGSCGQTGCPLFLCSFSGWSCGWVTNNRVSCQVPACRRCTSCWGRRLWTSLERPWSWLFLQASTRCRTICCMLPYPTWMQPHIRLEYIFWRVYLGISLRFSGSSVFWDQNVINWILWIQNSNVGR